jgi:hypothetical protein
VLKLDILIFDTSPRPLRMSSIKTSIRFTLLAYSVYCWVDGSARARTSFGPNFDIDTGSDLPSTENEAPPQGLRKVWDWLIRRGSAMSEEEQAAVAKVDAVVSVLNTHA